MNPLWSRIEISEISLTVSAGTIAESSGGSITDTLIRSCGFTNALIVPLTISGSATAGADFQSITATVEIPATQASTTFALVPLDDSHAENTETVESQVVPSQAFSAPSSPITVTITSDDVPELNHLQIDSDAGNIDFRFAQGSQIPRAQAQWSATLENASWATLTAPTIDLGDGIKRLPIPADAMNTTNFFIRWKID